MFLTPTYAHLEQNLPLSYSFVGDLTDEGSAKAETCRRHITKWQMIVCCYLCNCWIKWYIYFSSPHFKNVKSKLHSLTIIWCLSSPCLLGCYTSSVDISEKRLVSPSSAPSSPRQEALNVDAVRSSKVSVTTYQSTRHNIPLNVNPYWQRCEILKLTIVVFCFRELSP